MPRRRLVVISTIILVLSAMVIVPSCTDAECGNGGEGCSCTSVFECGELPTACHAWLCDGNCRLLQVSNGGRCLLGECSGAGTCVLGFCTAELACVECFENAHCDSGHTCEPSNLCSRCDDGVKNGDETGLDCDGSCPLCPGTCNVDADCPGGYCWEGSCARCDDGIQNGDETRIDCSPYLGHCPICYGLHCTTNDDCASKTCEKGYCCATSCPLCSSCKEPFGECKPEPYGFGDITNAENPSVVCFGEYVCDGKGKCALDKGNLCTQNEECASASCVNGKCT